MRFKVHCGNYSGETAIRHAPLVVASTALQYGQQKADLPAFSKIREAVPAAVIAATLIVRKGRPFAYLS